MNVYNPAMAKDQDTADFINATEKRVAKMEFEAMEAINFQASWFTCSAKTKESLKSTCK